MTVGHVCRPCGLRVPDTAHTPKGTLRFLVSKLLTHKAGNNGKSIIYIRVWKLYPDCHLQVVPCNKNLICQNNQGAGEWSDKCFIEDYQ